MVSGGTATLNGCDIYSNTAIVSACLHETTLWPLVLAFTNVLPLFGSKEVASPWTVAQSRSTTAISTPTLPA